MENILSGPGISGGTLKKNAIFSWITWLNGWISFIMGVLGLLVNMEWYIVILLFSGSLTAFFFCFISRRKTASTYMNVLFFFLFYVIMLPGCYMITKLEMCELQIYFILGIIFTAVTLEGKTQKILLTTEIAADCVSIWYVTYYISEGSYDTGAIPPVIYIRLLTAVAISGFAGGMLLKYRNRTLSDRIEDGRKRSLEAEQVNTSRDMFMANVSNEISAPLHTITETTQALLDMDMDAQRREDIFYIDSAGRRMLSATNALLEFAQKGRNEPGRRESSEKIYRDIVKAINHAAEQEERGIYHSTEKFVCPEARVLVVDDNIINAEILKSMLEPYQCRVYTATGGKECLEILAQQQVDIVFLDYIMPEMDGMETLRQLRTIPGCQEEKIPVIALTANAVSGAREMFLKGGFNAYMTKPVENVRLRQILKQYLPVDKTVRIS